MKEVERNRISLMVVGGGGGFTELAGHFSGGVVGVGLTKQEGK